MAKIRITKEFTFETGHALYGYDGLCKNVHGHSYKLNVTLIGTPREEPGHVKNGMLIDFSDLKKIVKREIVEVFDHATVLNVSTPHKRLADEMEATGHKIVRVNYQPTCELLLVDFAEKIKDLLPEGVTLFSLMLRETGTAFAEWFATDN
ncbi:MAG: 6-pyruvoyl trahydropterin synthase family protein [Flavobacteriaceae bacterium]